MSSRQNYIIDIVLDAPFNPDALRLWTVTETRQYINYYMNPHCGLYGIPENLLGVNMHLLIDLHQSYDDNSIIGMSVRIYGAHDLSNSPACHRYREMYDLFIPQITELLIMHKLGE
jgi:hypothetical protein